MPVPAVSTGGRPKVGAGARRAVASDSAPRQRFVDDVAKQRRIPALGVKNVIRFGDRIEAAVECHLGFGEVGGAAEAEMGHPPHHRENVLGAMIELGKQQRAKLLTMLALVDPADLRADRPRRLQKMLLRLARVTREEFEHGNAPASAVHGETERRFKAKPPAREIVIGLNR